MAKDRTGSDTALLCCRHKDVLRHRDTPAQGCLDAGMFWHKDVQLQGCSGGSFGVLTAGPCTSSGSKAAMASSPCQQPRPGGTRGVTPSGASLGRHNITPCISPGFHTQGVDPFRKREKHICRAQDNTQQKAIGLISIVQSGNYTRACTARSPRFSLKLPPDC